MTDPNLLPMNFLSLDKVFGNRSPMHLDVPYSERTLDFYVLREPYDVAKKQRTLSPLSVCNAVQLSTNGHVLVPYSFLEPYMDDIKNIRSKAQSPSISWQKEAMRFLLHKSSNGKTEMYFVNPKGSLLIANNADIAVIQFGMPGAPRPFYSPLSEYYSEGDPITIIGKKGTNPEKIEGIIKNVSCGYRVNTPRGTNTYDDVVGARIHLDPSYLGCPAVDKEGKLIGVACGRSIDELSFIAKAHYAKATIDLYAREAMNRSLGNSKG